MLWLIFGILIGAGAVWLISQVSAGKMQIKWYQWILGVIAIGTLLLTIQNYIGLGAELEPQAANFVLWAMGIPAIIFGLLAVFSQEIVSRLSKGSKAQDNQVASEQ